MNISYKELYNKLFIYSSCLLAIFPILTFSIRSITLIIWIFLGVLCAYHNRKNYRIHSFDHSKYLLLIYILPYILLCISLLYTSNLDAGYNRLRQLLPMVVFPIIFYLNKEIFTPKIIKKICWIFTVAVLLLVLYLMSISIFNLDYLLADLSHKELKSNNLQNIQNLSQSIIDRLKTRRFRNFILEQSNSHFTYQGLWIIFSVFFLFKEFFILLKFKNKSYIILFLAIVVLLTWLFLISSRMPILVMLIGSFLTLIIFKSIKLKKLITSLVLLSVFLISGFFIITPFKARVNEVLNYKFELPTSGDDIENYNSTNVRNGVYYCSFDTIKDNYLLGVGVGDCQDELNKCFKNKIGAKIYTWTDYNTHNQYLYFFLSTGILGVLSFIFLFYKCFKYAIINKKDLFFYFIIITSLICLTENIFSRSDGITFFALFSGLFLFNHKIAK